MVKRCLLRSSVFNGELQIRDLKEVRQQAMYKILGDDSSDRRCMCLKNSHKDNVI